PVRGTRTVRASSATPGGEAREPTAGPHLDARLADRVGAVRQDELPPAIPAATVVLLRDGSDGLETLMLRRNSKLAFAGGAWVFPGGRIDPDDYPSGTPTTDDAEVAAAARTAAVREAEEEAGLVVDPESLVWFAHWTPGPLAARRFATWFFMARAPEGV